jgi:hypothetical protein
VTHEDIALDPLTGIVGAPFCKRIKRFFSQRHIARIDALAIELQPSEKAAH